MSATSQPLKLTQVVHESETQRQHTRLPLPLKAVINRQRYVVKNISSGGAAIRNVEESYKKDSIVRIGMILPCEAFSLTLQLDAKVEYYNSQDKILGCSFINMKPEEIALLNHVLKASMAGELTTYGDVVSIVNRNNFVPGRKNDDSSEDKDGQVDIRNQLPKVIIISLLAVLLAFFVGANLYEKMFVVKASNVVIRGPSIEIRAMKDGIFESNLEIDTLSLKPDQPIGTLNESASGQSEILKSPCDCYVSKIYDFDGEYVSEGTRLATLIPMSAMPWVVVSMKPAEAAKLKMHQRANIWIMGSTMKYTGRIVDIESGMGDESVPPEYRFLEQPVIIRVRADQKIPLDTIGRPARVAFYTR